MLKELREIRELISTVFEDYRDVVHHEYSTATNYEEEMQEALAKLDGVIERLSSGELIEGRLKKIKVVRGDE